MARRTDDPTPRELREFAAIMAGALTILPLWGAWRDDFALTSARIAFLAIASVFLATGVVSPRSLRVPYLLWMRLGRLLGRLTSPVLLVAVFLLVVTPIGLVRRVLGRDPMGLRRAPPGGTYWRPRPPETRGRERFEHPF